MKVSIYIKSSIFFVFIFLSLSMFGQNKKSNEFYQLTVYHFKDIAQEQTLDKYLQNALLPALHKSDFKAVGVFKPLANDTAADKLLYVLIAFKTMKQILQLPEKLKKQTEYANSAKAYLQANYNAPPYIRMENIILQAFTLAPQMQLPHLNSGADERIYELRSYESNTEKLHENKVQMFNEGGEINLFKQLGFNAVFYSKVIAGSHMPNLMYMTCFENIQQRDAHWKTFTDNAEWKMLSADPQYQNNVSHIDITLMHATLYSDY